MSKQGEQARNKHDTHRQLAGRPPHTTGHSLVASPDEVC